MTLHEMDLWFRALLRIDLAEAVDSSRNGLQVARRNPEVRKVSFTVDASLEAFRRAAQWGADLLFAHHGILWNTPQRLEGTLYERVRFLMENDLALYAVHLPLDLHPEVGNNIGIARHLGLQQIEPFGEYRGIKLGFKGALPSPATVEEIAHKLSVGDATAARFLPFGPDKIRTVGIVSGSAPEESLQAIAEGLDLYVTGETTHRVYHDCLEARIHVIFAGHYLTETFGPRLLSERLARETGLETRYLDLPTGL